MARFIGCMTVELLPREILYIKSKTFSGNVHSVLTIENDGTELKYENIILEPIELNEEDGGASIQY
jgi:hypothetical protein